MKSINPDDFKVVNPITLSKLPTDLKSQANDDEKEEKLDKVQVKLSKLQDVMYAHNRYGVLICLQGMDTSGKDGVVRHVFSGINPQGIRVSSFKKPSEEELAHDYLWRCTMRLPERGQIGVFNRSYYEEVIVVKVIPELLKYQNLPGVSEDIWKERYKEIDQFESRLTRNGTKVIKCFLHLSKEEQRKRLLERLEDKEKNWKFQPSDLEARKLWSQFQGAYEECLENTNTKENPWYIVPADNKQNARIIIASILKEVLSDLPLRYPDLDKEIQDRLAAFKMELG